MEKQILQWLDDRDRLLEKKDDEAADSIETKITNILIAQNEKFSCDFILETMTRFGASPSVIYDDNGKWAVLTDGTQPVVYGDNTLEGHVDMRFFCERGHWFETIREALLDYLNRR